QRRPVQLLGPTRHPPEEIELLAELWIGLAVGNVAAGGNVDVLQHHALPGTEQFYADVPRLAIVLPVMPRDLAQRDAADRGDAVIALLPMDHPVRVAGGLEHLVRE